MNLFEQQTNSNTIKLEKIAFGNPLPPVGSKVKKEEPIVETNEKPKEKVSISKVSSKIVDAEPIIIKKDEPLPFQVVDQSPYNAQNPIPIDEPYPSGVIYKIQLGAYSKPLDVAFFKGMIPVAGEKASGGKVTKYYIGKFKKLEDAEKALPVVRSKGFKDAFINAWLNGKTIPLTRAQTIEDKQSEEQNPENKLANPVDTTSTMNKIYQIQIGKFDSRLPDDISRTVKALAIGKDIIRKTDGQGKTIYLISSYNNIEDANRVKDNLIAAGISGAVVVDLSVEKK
jgi:cell division protein FtsN